MAAESLRTSQKAIKFFSVLPHIDLDIEVDISIATVDLMQELTDVDTLTESDEGATALIGALVR